MSDLHADRRKLLDKLCRELIQSERDAELHPAREARRLGDVPPARAFRAIAEHAHTLRPELQRIARARRVPGKGVARTVAEFFSGSRHLVADRAMRTERSYRMTLLGLRHGLELVKLIYKVAAREHIADLTSWCERNLIEREPLLERAVAAMAWFADEPAYAMKSGLRAAARHEPLLDSFDTSLMTIE
jgi:hypothetical protein